MEKGDWNLDFEKIREKKLEERELKRLIAVAEQNVFELWGDGKTLEAEIQNLQALYELQELREGKRKKGERGEKG